MMSLFVRDIFKDFTGAHPEALKSLSKREKKAVNSALNQVVVKHLMA